MVIQLTYWTLEVRIAKGRGVEDSSCPSSSIQLRFHRGQNTVPLKPPCPHIFSAENLCYHYQRERWGRAEGGHRYRCRHHLRASATLTLGTSTWGSLPLPSLILFHHVPVLRGCHAGPHYPTWEETGGYRVEDELYSRKTSNHKLSFIPTESV